VKVFGQPAVAVPRRGTCKNRSKIKLCLHDHSYPEKL
jgi:hypothetical protein